MREYLDIRPLKLGARNNQMPLVVLGYGAYIHNVEEELRDTCPVWAFSFPNHIEFYVWNGNPDHLTVYNIARVYADLILKHIPNKKIILAGHSFFGLIAFEVACQLKENNIDTTLIVLIDTHLRRVPVSSFNQVMLNIFRHRKLMMAIRHLLLRWFPPAAGQMHTKGTCQPLSAPDNGDLASAISQLAGLQRFLKWRECGTVLTEVRRQAMLGYMIKPLLCKGILIRVEISENEILHGFLPDFGWREYFRGGLTIEKTEGDHSSLVEHPYKINLAKKIKKIVANQFQKSKE